jgi:hypothetical protein
MAKFNINMSGMGGLSQYPSQSLRNVYAVKDGTVVDGEYNPFIRYGYISPTTSSITSVTTDNSQNSIFKACHYDAINDDFYLFENGAIYRGDTTTDTSLTRVVTTPNNNADIAADLEIYQVNGVRKIFGVYQSNAGKAEILISSLPYDSATDNLTWLSGTVSGAFSNDLVGDAWMNVADNGFAYLFMENQVYKIDGTIATGGTNGTISSALLFPNGYKMVDSLDYRGNIFIGIHNYPNDTRNNNPSFIPSGKLEVGVYIWNRSTTVSSGADYIPLSGFKEIKKIFLSPSGKVRVIAIDDTGYTHILQYGGSDFQPIFKVGYNAYPTHRDSVSSFGHITTWFGHDGVLYMYGSINPGDEECLYKLYHVAVASTTGGVILTSPGTSTTPPALYITYQASGGTLTNSRLKIFTITSQAASDVTAGGTITFPLKYIPKLSTVNFIRIFGVPSATTGSTTIATINIFLNQSTTQWASKTVTLDQWSRGYIDIPVDKPYVNSIQLDLVYASGLTIGTSDFAPAYAEVDYTPTETNK